MYLGRYFGECGVCLGRLICDILLIPYVGKKVNVKGATVLN